MAFDKINKVSEQELTPLLQEKINSKLAKVDFDKHNNDMVRHITAEERENWDNTLDNANKYTDKKFSTIVGNLPDSSKSIIDYLNLKYDKTSFEAFKATLSTVAFSGKYDDLIGKPATISYSDQANSALEAEHAKDSDHADKADQATNATTANNAITVNGIRVYVQPAAPSVTNANDKVIWFDTTNKIFKCCVNLVWYGTKSVW